MYWEGGGCPHAPGPVSLQTVLYLLLPLRCLLPTLRTQAVRPSAGVKIKEAAVVRLLRSSRRNTGRLGNSLHFTEVNGPLAVEVLPGVVVPQLVLDGVQHKPSLLPSFQKSSPLV